MSKYIRTTVKDFCELPENIQDDLLKDNELSDLTSDRYVKNPCDEKEFLSLNMFVRTDSNLWDGVYGTSYFSAYFIKFDRDRETCTVGYRHW